MNKILIPEEIILNSLEAALQHEFPPLITDINLEKREEWLTPFRTIERGKQPYYEMPKPICLMDLTKTAKKESDPFVEQSEYEITLRIQLNSKDPDYRIYRYAYALNRLFKESIVLNTLYDRHLFEECLYYTFPTGDPAAEGKFLIRLYREELK